MAFPLQFLLLCIGLFNFCLATTPPKGAPISSCEWALCEKFIQTKAHSFFSQGIYTHRIPRIDFFITDIFQFKHVSIAHVANMGCFDKFKLKASASKNSNF